MKIDFSNKTVIVTGGTRNIGKASTLRLADLGYDIILTWNSSKNKAAEVVKKINSNVEISNINSIEDIKAW